jgi:hypothetical protein
MMHIQTWILIADGARARVLESNEADHPLRAIEDLVFHGDHSSTPPAALIFRNTASLHLFLAKVAIGPTWCP